MRSSAGILTLALAAASACDRTPEAKPDSFAATSAKPAQSPPGIPSVPTEAAALAPLPSYKLPSSARLVAIGDIHGDLSALRATLRLAGAIDSEDSWIGKDLTVVQTGDQLDRGDQDREVLDVIEKLEREAQAAGGALYALNGNHELMNASFDYRYVTHKSNAAFHDFSKRASGAAQQLPQEEQGRAAAFTPGAEYALKLAKHLTIALVGDSLFAHGGVLPAHVDYGLDRFNAEAQAFLTGRRPLAKALSAEDSPVWTRAYGGEVDEATCSALARVLKEVGAKRLIVGHTVQKGGINSACQERVFRIDVGLSRFYGDNPAQVLEVTAQGARILKAGEARSKGKTGDSAVQSRP